MTALRWRRPGGSDPHPQASLVSLVAMLLAFESSLYSAVTPVLPHYAHALHASKPALGLLSAAYPAGLIPGSLIGGWVASRVGVRRTTLAGLILFGVAVAAFGFATDLVALDALRAVQGLFCGLIWGGGLTWVIAASPPERRGATIGAAIAAATFGTLIGPLLGTAAVAIGTRPVFCALGLVSLALAAWTRRHPAPPRTANDDGPRPPLRAALRTAGLPLGTWLITLEALTIGATNVLLPLRLSRLGASGVAIGATFVAAAALSSVLSPIVGRMSDRRGARLLLVTGLGVSAVLVSALVLPHTAAVLAPLSVIALGGPLAAYVIPAVSMMTASAEAVGIALVLVTTLGNLAYATGETIGAPVAAGLSEATSDAVPILLLAALMLATLWPVSRLRRTPTPIPPVLDPEPEPEPGPLQPSTTGSSVTSRATSAA
jgi:MFS family permease